jgi:Polyketide cyclase / dehydrase and lipid transport
MTALVTTIEVDRPAAGVFTYVSDPNRFHEWQAGVVDGHLDSAQAPAAGDACYTTRRIGGANRSPEACSPS